MGILFKKKKKTLTLDMYEDIKNFTIKKVEELKNEVLREYCYYTCDPICLGPMCLSGKVESLNLCVDFLIDFDPDRLNYEFDRSNLQKGLMYQLEVNDTYTFEAKLKVFNYGAYLHPEEMQNTYEYKKKCQLAVAPYPYYSFKVAGGEVSSRCYAAHYKTEDIIQVIENKSRIINDEVKEYCENCYPEYKHCSFWLNTDVGDGINAVGNSDQYVEFFMDRMFDYCLSHKSKYWNWTGNKYELDLEQLRRFPIPKTYEFQTDLSIDGWARNDSYDIWDLKKFGLDLKFDMENIIRHLKYKAENGYHIPEEYYSLVSKDMADKIKKIVNDRN